MSAEQIGGVVRTIAAAVFGWVAGQGYIDADTATALAGAAATIGVAVWSVISKHKLA
jgi:hypothetical protein